MHDMCQARIPFIRDGVIAKKCMEWKADERSEVLKGFNVLEVGCTGGVLTEALAMLGANVVGVDPSEKLIAVAKDHLFKSNLKIEYFCETIEEHSKDNIEKYDVVIACDIEHQVDKITFFRACVAALKPGGSFFTTTFSKNWFARFCIIFLGENVFRTLPQGGHDYDLFIGSSAVSKILNDLNCRTTKVSGIHYDFFRHVSKLTTNKTIQYALQAVKQCKVVQDEK